MAENYALLHQYKQAERVLSRIESLAVSKVSRLIITDTLMQIAIAQGDLPRASQCVATAEKLGEFETDDYLWLWHLSTRCQLLARQNQGSAALALIATHRSEVQKTRDYRLGTRFKWIEVEALIAAGNPLEAATMLSALLQPAPKHTLETEAELSRLCSMLSKRSEKSFMQRSETIRRLGLEGRSAKKYVKADERMSSEEVLHSVAALASFADHASLIADEAARLLIRLSADGVHIDASRKPSNVKRPSLPNPFALFKTGNQDTTTACTRTSHRTPTHIWRRRSSTVWFKEPPRLSLAPATGCAARVCAGPGMDTRHLL